MVCELYLSKAFKNKRSVGLMEKALEIASEEWWGLRKETTKEIGQKDRKN